MAPYAPSCCAGHQRQEARDPRRQRHGHQLSRNIFENALRFLINDARFFADAFHLGFRWLLFGQGAITTELCRLQQTGEMPFEASSFIRLPL